MTLLLKATQSRLGLTLAVLAVTIVVLFRRQHIYTLAIDQLGELPDLPFASPNQDLDPLELLDRPLSRDLGAIPRIFHQSWKSRDLPERMKVWSDTCRRTHPDWKFVLWSDADNRILIEKYAPWLVQTYDNAPRAIERVDLVRNLYMYLFGGYVLFCLAVANATVFTADQFSSVYADLDMECLRSSTVIFDDYNVTTVPVSPHAHINSRSAPSSTRTAFFGRMGRNTSFEHSIPNAWMASTPGHPFFALPLDFAMEHIAAKGGTVEELGAEEVTGPIALRSQILRYEAEFQGQKMDDHMSTHGLGGLFAATETPMAHAVELLPHNTIYPYAWTEEDLDLQPICWASGQNFNREICKQALHVKLQGSVAITYWSHTW